MPDKTIDTASKTSERKKNVKKGVSLLLIFTLIITGLFAFLTATDTKTNVFTIGNVAIDLIG